MARPWYTTSYRRNLVDMHIEDWDEMFLSKFDPLRYVEYLRLARVKTAMVYANSHVGYSYWPTKSGRMHRGIKGRDVLGEIIQGCHQGGMDVVVYFSLVFNNLAYETHPEWRMVDAKGQPTREGEHFSGWLKPRYGICCPNNQGYRDFVAAQLGELCGDYEFEGFFFDMNFWPDVCYCAQCRARYKRETGNEIPLVIDWSDANWNAFQTCREAWMAEMGVYASTVAKKLKPGVTTEHNFAQITINWEFGFTDKMLPSCDYLGGDFYGSFLHASFISKLLWRMSPNRPFEYMTSRCQPGLTFHTDTKPKDVLRTTNFIALAHQGALLFIDAINLDGTQDRRVYQLMGEVFGESMPYEEYLGGEPVADVGIYFSVNAKMDPAENGGTVADHHGDKGRYPHLEAAVGAARVLKDNHVPFGVVTKAGLSRLSDFGTLVVPDAARMDGEEVSAISQYLEGGGCLYASGRSVHALARHLGVEVVGETEEEFTYIAPVAGAEEYLPDVTTGSPLTIPHRQVIVRGAQPDTVKGHVALPFTRPKDPIRFSSIHSNPPGKVTQHPALIHKKVGRGQIVWVSGPIEREDRWVHAGVFLGLIRRLHARPFQFDADAPAQVELTVFDDHAAKRLVVCLVNMQERMPVLPVRSVAVKLRSNGRKLGAPVLVPGGQKLKHRETGEWFVFQLPELEIFHMVVVPYGAAKR